MLMLHRFGEPGRGSSFHTSAELAAILEVLRRRRFALLSLGDLIRMLSSGESIGSHTVVFTVDDGYADFGALAAPIFESFECPVTVFVATGFIDGHTWFWWDQIEYVLQRTVITERDVTLSGTVLRLSLDTKRNRERSFLTLVARLKQVREEEKAACVDRLFHALEVDIPASAPDAYRAMTWDDIRSWSRRGVSFGPHTVTHPILAQVTDSDADGQIRGSRARLIEELGDPGPAFCYPNGNRDSFGDRECALVEAVGYPAAISAISDYIGPGPANWEQRRWSLPRFSCPHSPGRLLALVAGIRRF